MADKNVGLVGGILMAIGVILTVIFPPLGLAWQGAVSSATVGGILVAAGALANVALALSMRGGADRASRGATYGVDVRSNPNSAEAMIPIAYGSGDDSPRVIPPIIAQGVLSIGETPKTGSIVVAEQGLRILLAVAEGPVKEIRDVRFNDTAIFSDPIADSWTGNGTRSAYVLSSAWAHVPRLVVKVAGTQVFNSSTAVSDYVLKFPAAPTSADGAPNSSTYTAKGLQSRTTKITGAKRERILYSTIRVFVNGTEAKRLDTLYGWKTDVQSPRLILLVFHHRPKDTDRVTATFSKVADQNVFFQQTGKGQTTILFGAGRIPGSGVAVTADYVRENFPGVKVETRLGALQQEPIPGFDSVVGSQGPDPRTMPKNTARKLTTDHEADDVRIGFVAPYGMKHFSSDGSEEATSARVTITVERRNLSASSGFDAPVALRTMGPDGPVNVFTLGGLVTGKRIWEVSVRTELQRLIDAGDADAIDQLEAFNAPSTATSPRIFRISVERKTAVLQDSDSTYIDAIEFGYVTTVEEQAYIYPGLALLAVSAKVGEALGGQIPIVSCVVDRGDIYDPRTGGVSSSSNPALALYDLITSAGGEASDRYGGGQFFDEDDLDLVGLGALADWCDAYVDPATGADATSSTGERRHRLSLAIDADGDLLEWAADIAVACRCLLTLQGVRWRFPIDRDGTSVYAFAESRTDPAGSNIRAGSLSYGADALGKVPTELRLGYWNRDIDGGKHDEALFYRKNLAATARRVTSRVSIVGESRPTAIARLGAFILRAAQESDVPVTWQAHPGAMLPEAGDLVTVASDRLGWTTPRVVRIVAMQRAASDPETVPWISYIGRVYRSNIYSAKDPTPATKPTPPSPNPVGGSGSDVFAGNSANLAVSAASYALVGRR